MTRVLIVAAAVALTFPASQVSAQQFTCVMGMAGAFSPMGETTAANDRAGKRSPDIDQLARAAAACDGRTFLSANPSVLRRQSGDRASWAIGLRGASMGLSGAIDRDRFVAGDDATLGGTPTGAGVAVVRLDDRAQGNGPNSLAPGAVCGYLGGTNCVGGTSGLGVGGGYGATGNPGQTISQNPTAFVDVIQGANGSNGNAWGSDGNGTDTDGNGNGTGGAGTTGVGGGPDVGLGVTVLDVLDAPADEASIVPEPATMTLLASGLAGMALARRRKNQNR